jgi:flavin-dependent dehydrogenase
VDAEVIVAGGGPAGSATATLLARAGHDVLLLDRARFPRDKACAEYLSPATEDVLARLGALPAVEAHHPVRPLGMHLIGAHGARALVRYPDGARSRRALCLPRRLLDATLLEQARAAGVRVVEGWQVHEVVSGRGGQPGIVVGARAVSDAPGRRKRFTASVLVGADGMRSVVTRVLGLDAAVYWPRRVGLIARVSGVAAADGCGEMYTGRGVYCGLAPLPAGLTNVGLVMDAGLVRGAGGPRGVPRAGLARLPGAAARLKAVTYHGPIRGVAPLARRVRRVYGDGYLLVGDAAGFLDPFTGEGVFRALRGAELAAEVIATALRRGCTSAAALAPYAEARRREFLKKEALCWVIQGLLRWPPFLAYALRRLARREAAAAVLGAVLGDYRPADEALRATVLWELLRP